MKGIVLLLKRKGLLFKRLKSNKKNSVWREKEIAFNMRKKNYRAKRKNY